jgi:hypothetical protein
LFLNHGGSLQQADREALLVAQRSLKETMDSVAESLQHKLGGVNELVAAERAARRDEVSSMSSSFFSQLRELRDAVSFVIWLLPLRCFLHDAVCSDTAGNQGAPG